MQVPEIYWFEYHGNWCVLPMTTAKRDKLVHQNENPSWKTVGAASQTQNYRAHIRKEAKPLY